MTIPTHILDTLGFSELLPDEQQELLIDLNSLIFEGTMVRLVERMDHATRDEFAKLMETDPSEEAVEEFLRSRVPDADGAAVEAIKEVTDDILSATGN